VAKGSKVSVCGRSIAGIAGSNFAKSMGVYLLWVLCCQKSPRRADPTSRGVPLSVECHWA
jgi:hypothetical protein